MSEASGSPFLDWLIRDAGTGDAPSPPTGSVHLDDEALAALLEAGPGVGPPPEVIDHLSRCAACRSAAIEQWREALSLDGIEDLPFVPRDLERQALRHSPAGSGPAPVPRPVWPWFRPVPILAGTAVALVLSGMVLLLPRDRIVPGAVGPERTLRGSPSARLLAPSGKINRGSPVVFEWTAVPGATAYEVVVADPARGSETILRFEAVATRRELSPAEQSLLATGHTYQWLLKSERGVGQWEAAGPVEFVIEE